MIPAIVSLEQFREERAAAMKPPREARFGRVSYSEIRTLKRVPPDWIVKGWMVAGEISFLVGEPQIGKSFLATHAALCVAAGLPVFGMAVKQGLVIYIAAESATGVTRQRIPAWQDHYGKGLESLPFEVFTTKVDLFRPDGDADQIIDAIKKIQAEWGGMPVRLVVIDTLSKVMPGASEIDGKDVGRVLDNFDKIAKQTGAHVMSPAHPSKGGKGVRGHGSFKGNVDSVAELTMDESSRVRTLSFDKIKDGPKDGKYQFELLYLVLGKEEDGSDFGSCVVLPTGRKAALQAEAPIGFKLNDKETIFMECVFEAQAKKPEPIPEGMAVPKSVLTITLYDNVKRIYAKKNPFSADPDASDEEAKKAKDDHKFRLRKEFEKLQTTLQKFGVISISDPFIWWTGKPLRAFLHTLPKKETVGTVPDDVAKDLEGVDFG